MLIAKSIGLFVLAGLLEIGGGYLVWLWLREGGSIGVAVAGAVVLILYGVIPTLQPAHFGGVYAAYGAYSWSCRSCGDGKWTIFFRTGSMSSAA